MKSLLHYIEWRLENSYAMIVWKTIKLAEDINRKMSEEYFQYYTEIKTKKKKYDSLAHLKEFQNITYTECKPVKFDGDFKSKKSFPYYNEIVSTQIPMYHCTSGNTCPLLLARIAHGKKRLDPNYLGSFDFKSPLTLDHFIKTDK